MGQNHTFTEVQYISAGQQFTGTAPAGARSAILGGWQYAASAAGGLFTLIGESSDTAPWYPRTLRRLALNLGGQSSWSVSILVSGSEDVVLLSGTTETDVVLSDSIYLAPTDRLKITTVGASGAMSCQCVYEIAADLS